MRSAPANFGEEELRDAVAYCHARGVKVYVTCNTLPRNDEFEELPGFLSTCQEIGVDAFIISDLGVLALAKQVAPQVERHVSTQTGIVNFAAAQVCWELGAKRVVLAREVPLSEIRGIRERVDPQLELEAFVHGAMCMSFSGRCVISNYMTGRDANRGECAQPCRWEYHLMETQRPGGGVHPGPGGEGRLFLQLQRLTDDRPHPGDDRRGRCQPEDRGPGQVGLLRGLRHGGLPAGR